MHGAPVYGAYSIGVAHRWLLLTLGGAVDDYGWSWSWAAWATEIRFDDCVWSFEGSPGGSAVHDKRPSGVAARPRAPNATHTDVRGTRVHRTARLTVFGVNREGPGLPRRLARRQRRRAPNVTHADVWETCVRQTVRCLVVSGSAPCTRHARETLEIIAREQRASSRHARNSKSLKSIEETSTSGGPAPG